MKVRSLCCCFLPAVVALLPSLFVVAALCSACQDLNLSELSLGVPAARLGKPDQEVAYCVPCLLPVLSRTEGKDTG